MKVYKIIKFNSITQCGVAVAPNGDKQHVTMTYGMSPEGNWYNDAEKRWMDLSEIEKAY